MKARRVCPKKATSQHNEMSKSRTKQKRGDHDELGQGGKGGVILVGLKHGNEF